AKGTRMIATLPSKQIVERAVSQDVAATLRAAGVASWMSAILASRMDRPFDPQELLEPSLARIPDPIGIPSMDRAVDRIVSAIASSERFALACDHDMDGTASAAVLWTALTEFFGVPRESVHVVTSHRLKEGYGLTTAVVDRIITLAPGVVITADKGSSDEPRISLLAARGIDVVVTDHHQIPSSGPPPSAYCVVNPSRQESTFDPHVCGAGVAFLVMAKVRTALLNRGVRSKIASLSGLLDYVAVATIADCVSLSPSVSSINRTFVKRGLELLNEKRRSCWKVFAESIGDQPIDAEAIAFRLVPAIAAAGRLDWAKAGFQFLIAPSKSEAASHWAVLQQENAERQQIERDLRVRALARAAQMDTRSIVLMFDDGHPGVHGITASRLVEAFGKPAALFAPRGNGVRDSNFQGNTDLLTGSFRSIPGINIHEVISAVASSDSELVVSHGGHHGAAGAVVRRDRFERFRVAFEEQVAVRCGGKPLLPLVQTDGQLASHLHSVEVVKTIDRYGPWGRGFDYPIFAGRFHIKSLRLMSEGQHARLELARDELRIRAVWFNARDQVDLADATVGRVLASAYRLRVNRYQGIESPEIQIVHGVFESG
ncbi:DHH family phosphoesterase, partial [uncultured Nevskia sp.]|uniref:single-stranded-DNA-specific exonuclease RecJ n=2 Tax=Nevskia TaxID=64001 RepID=UPI0025E6F9BA